MTLIPGLLTLIPRLFSFCRQPQTSTNQLVVLLDFLALLAQGFGLIYILNQDLIAAISLILISTGYWQNYVESQYLDNRLQQDSKNFTYTLLSVCKIFFILISMLLVLQLNDVLSWDAINFTEAFSNHVLNVTEVYQNVESSGKMLQTFNLPMLEEEHRFLREVNQVFSSESFPIYVLLAHVLCSYFVYFFGKLACELDMQIIGFAMRLILTVPFTVILINFACDLNQINEGCAFHG